MVSRHARTSGRLPWIRLRLWLPKTNRKYLTAMRLVSQLDGYKSNRIVPAVPKRERGRLASVAHMSQVASTNRRRPKDFGAGAALGDCAQVPPTRGEGPYTGDKGPAPGTCLYLASILPAAALILPRPMIHSNRLQVPPCIVSPAQTAKMTRIGRRGSTHVQTCLSCGKDPRTRACDHSVGTRSSPHRKLWRQGAYTAAIEQ